MTPLAKSYLTIFAALLLVFGSASFPIAQQSIISFIVASILTFVLLFALLYMKPGFFKWLIFGIFVVSFGQLLAVSVKDAVSKGVLDDILISVVGISLAMTALAFYDTKNRFLGWGSYLFVGLIGLIVARLVVLGLSFSSIKTESLGSVSNILSLVGSALFAAYLAYDTQLMRLRIQRNEKHDYVDYALGPFLDIVNLFANLEDLFN